MNRNFFIYPNFSKGGVSAVLRGRAASSRHLHFDALFKHDRGGSSVFQKFDNIDPRVVRQDRLPAYLKFALAEFAPSEVSVLSAPDVLEICEQYPDPLVAYEVHSSDLSVVKRELESLASSRVDELRVPSEFMANQLQSIIPNRLKRKVIVVPNLVDHSVFGPDGSSELGDVTLPRSAAPLVWVGRFDKGKGYRQFLRTLALLPEQYVGVMVVSLESDPARMVSFLSETYALGVANRVRVMSDVEPSDLANLFRAARDRGGALVSTSLLESFGYAIAEALACELRVSAFDLPVLAEHQGFKQLGVAVPPGDVHALAESISAR